MKTQLTAEQSAKLIELGVSSLRASEIKEYDDEVSRWTHRGDPIFTLIDILNILPKEIKRSNYNSYTFSIVADNHYWNVEYRYWRGDYAENDTLALFESEELIDALYSLLVWCLEKGYVK